MAKKTLKLILAVAFLMAIGYSKKINTSDTRITYGAQIMAYLFDKYGDCDFIVKYRKDKKFLGVLIINSEEEKSNILKVFDTATAEEVFEYDQKERSVTNFNFKKNAVIISYKSTLWEEKIAFDIGSGRLVKRYSSWGVNK